MFKKYFKKCCDITLTSWATNTKAFIAIALIFLDSSPISFNNFENIVGPLDSPFLWGFEKDSDTSWATSVALSNPETIIDLNKLLLTYLRS